MGKIQKNTMIFPIVIDTIKIIVLNLMLFIKYHDNSSKLFCDFHLVQIFLYNIS